MAYGQIDPARLQGDDLTRWYLRSPTDVEKERQAAAAGRYADFFGAQPQSPVQSQSETAPSAPGDTQDSQHDDMRPPEAFSPDVSATQGSGRNPGVRNWALDGADLSTGAAPAF